MMKYLLGFSLFLFSCFLANCEKSGIEEPEDDMPIASIDTTKQAVITGVTYSGNSNAYNFSVTIKSPDTGCDQYADWWEVFTPDSVLIYRRILAHSHVNEQPFTRSGGPVDILPESVVLVRAHMNTSGYGSIVYRGSVADGFFRDTLPSHYGIGLASLPPLPERCAF